MPAWITSLLRDEVSVPMPSAASRTITSRPASASARATARPTTPAPTTTQSTDSTRSSLAQSATRKRGLKTQRGIGTASIGRQSEA